MNEYYKLYKTLHQNEINRYLHFTGNSATIAHIVFCLSLEYYWWLLLTPFIVYPFAWTGHMFFEKNKPAAWSNPIKAKLCDWLMMRDMLTGRF